jgi:hypothetical protein
MNIQEFHAGMKKNFGVKSNPNQFICPVLFQLNKVSLDVINFDRWLRQQHGEYDENRDISMAMLVTEKYGADACEWLRSTI